MNGFVFDVCLEIGCGVEIGLLSKMKGAGLGFDFRKLRLGFI